MIRNGLALLLLGAVAAGAWSIRTWLDRRAMDRWDALFLSGFALGVAILLAALFFHFGRFA